MRRITVIVMSTLIAGCASYSERQAQPPWLTAESAKAPEAFAGCFVPLMREMPGIYGSGPDGDATVYTITAPNSSSTLAAVTVRASGSGSIAELRSATQTGWYKRLAERIDSCR